MGTITASIAALGFFTAVLAANSGSAQVAFDRPDAYTNTYSAHHGSVVGAYAYTRAIVSRHRNPIPPVRCGARNCAH